MYLAHCCVTKYNFAVFHKIYQDIFTSSLTRPFVHFGIKSCVSSELVQTFFQIWGLAQGWYHSVVQPCPHILTTVKTRQCQTAVTIFALGFIAFQDYFTFELSRSGRRANHSDMVVFTLTLQPLIYFMYLYLKLSNWFHLNSVRQSDTQMFHIQERPLNISRKHD